ncbi:hypothetical protein ACFMBG_15485 [Leisingera sp. D0M16]|uniref:hypothetical protein n=1 Tax=Leisingera coralii TaxID=3351347 RepID=UPI003B7FB488
MVIALVRRIDTQHFIGFFAAPDIPALAQLVQEADHPTECEFAEIPSGGFVCGNPYSYDVRIPLQEKEDRQIEPFDAEWPHSFEVFDAAEPTEGLACRDVKLFLGLCQFLLGFVALLLKALESVLLVSKNGLELLDAELGIAFICAELFALLIRNGLANRMLTSHDQLQLAPDCGNGVTHGQGDSVRQRRQQRLFFCLGKLFVHGLDKAFQALLANSIFHVVLAAKLGLNEGCVEVSRRDTVLNAFADDLMHKAGIVTERAPAGIAFALCLLAHGMFVFPFVKPGWTNPA